MRTSVMIVGLAAAVLLAGCNLPFIPGGGGAVGSAAKDLVDSARYPKLVIELDHPAGSAPNAEAKSVLRNTLAEVSGRAAGSIEIVEEAEIPSEPSKKYSVQDLVRLESEHRDRKTGGDTAVLYVLYVAGGYSEDSGDSRILGVAYRGTSVAIMKGNIKASSKSSVLDLKPDEQCIERAVLVHEFGHAAGLVNLGTPMVRDHEDPTHPKHSSNKESVMYYAVEDSRDLLSLFTGSCGSIPFQFDNDDKADLRALRG